MEGHCRAQQTRRPAGALGLGECSAPGLGVETARPEGAPEGDLPDASYGERMPRDAPKLNGTLRDVIRAWIEAGAPPTGWVPGTF